MRALLACSLFVCLLPGISGCRSAPLIGEALIGVDDESGPLGLGFISYDGNVLVAYSRVRMEAGLYGKYTGAPYMGPVSVPHARVLVVRRDPEFSQSFEWGESLPEWVFAHVRPATVERFMLDGWPTMTDAGPGAE